MAASQRVVFNADEDMSETVGGQQGVNDVHINVQKGLIRHKDMLNLRSEMAVDLAVFAVLILAC